MQLSMKKVLANKDKAKLRYIIFDFDESYEEIIVLKTGEEDRGKTEEMEYKDFLGVFMSPNMSSLAIYDMPYITKAGASHSTPILLHYNAERADMKMLDRLRRKVVVAQASGLMQNTFKVGLVHTGEDGTELGYDLVIGLLKK